MDLLEVKNLNKYYDKNKSSSIHALKDINISLNQGELVAVIGESGSGKSTLMNIIGMLDSDFEGDISVSGKNIRKFTKKEIDNFRKNKVGFIFQSFNLIPHLSILDNVTIPMTLNGLDRKSKIRRGIEMLKRLGLEREIYKKPNQLSGGQKQRAAIARALINDPDIIIADEPTGSLDSKNTKQILEILKDLVNFNKLVIMVTHSEKVAAAADRVIEIKDGEITNDITRETAVTIDEKYSLKEKKFNHKKKGTLSLLSAVKLSLINMKEKIMRNILISFGTSIGIISVILMLSFGNGIKSYFNNTMNSYVNPLVIEVSMNEEDDDDTDEEANIFKMPKVNNGKSFSEEELDELKSLDNVEKVEKGYNIISMGANSIRGENGGCNLIRFSTISSNLLESGVSYGRFPESGEILINKGTLNKLGYTEEEAVGKKVSLSLLLGEKKVKNDFVISGIYDTYGDFNSMFKCAFINYEDLEAIYEENKISLNPNIAYITVSNDKKIESTKEQVKELGYAGSSEEQMTGLFNEMINILTYALSGIATVSLIVSSIMILVVLYISVMERVKEIGILKSIGARKKDIRRIFLWEAFLIGVFSGTLGCMASYGLVKLINRVTQTKLTINLVILDKRYLFYGLIVSVVVSLIAGIIPAAKASAVDPIKSLRRE